MGWKHSPVLSQSRGKFKMYCTCGAQSAKTGEIREAVDWYTQHTGLRETHPGPVRQT